MKKIKKVYNTKLLYRWSLPMWFTLIFILVAIAPAVVACIWQYASYGNPDSMVVIKGSDFIMNVIATITGDTTKTPESIGGLLNFVNATATEYPDKFKTVAQLFVIFINWIIPIGLALTAIFVLVLVIMFLIGLISGRLSHWKGPFIISIWALIGEVVFFGIGLVIFIFYETQKADTSFATAKFDFMFPCIYLGVGLIATIVLGIIYSAGFYGKEYIPNKEYLDNFIQQQNHGIGRQISYSPQPIIINNNTTQATPSEIMTNVPAKIVEEKNNEPKVKEVIKTITKVNYVNKEKIIHMTELPKDIKHIGGHEYSKNTHLTSANIPEGVPSIGVSAFSNCVNLKIVYIPTTVKEIGFNAFFNCVQLEKIVYAGSKDDWRKIKRGSNWLNKARTTIVSCKDGPLSVNPYR